MSHRIDTLRAPLLVCWQLTRNCDLCCLHCCTESAPGKALPDELDAVLLALPTWVPEALYTVAVTLVFAGVVTIELNPIATV